MLRASRQNLVDILRRERVRLLARGVSERTVHAKFKQFVDSLRLLFRRLFRSSSSIVLVVLAAAAQDGFVESVLARRRLEQGLLVRVLGDEAVHLDLFGLSDTVTSRHGLQIVLWVPIAVEDDGGVRRREGDAHAAGARGQQVGESGSVESVDARLTIFSRRVAVETFGLVPGAGEKVLNEIQDDGELRKDEHLVTVALQLGEQFREQTHLTAPFDEHALRVRRVFVLFGSRGESLGDVILLQTVAQEWVIAHLSKLHGEISKLRDVFHLGSLQEDVNLIFVEGAIVGALLRRQLHPHYDFLLGRNLFHILLHAAKHARFENVSQTHDLLGVDVARGVAKFLLEIVPRVELSRIENV